LGGVAVQSKFFVGEETVDGVDWRGLMGNIAGLGSFVGSRGAVATGGPEIIVNWVFALSFIHHLSSKRVAELIELYSLVTGMTSLAIALRTTWACRVGDAKLAGVQEESVGVRDVEMFLLFDQTGFLLSNCLYKSFT
jgi:hypothetical protein